LIRRREKKRAEGHVFKGNNNVPSEQEMLEHLKWFNPISSYFRDAKGSYAGMHDNEIEKDD